jgi:hypothetical protein
MFYDKFLMHRIHLAQERGKESDSCKHGNKNLGFEKDSGTRGYF